MPLGACVRVGGSWGLVKFVAYAPDGQDVAGVLGVGLNLTSQAVYVRVNVALIAFVLGAPDLVEQVVARPGAAGLARESFEYVKLKRRQLDAVAADRHL